MTTNPDQNVLQLLEITIDEKDRMITQCRLDADKARQNYDIERQRIQKERTDSIALQKELNKKNILMQKKN